MKIRNKDGTINEITLTDVLYIEDLSCNVISIFTARERGFTMGETPNGPSLTKGEIKLESQIKMKEGNSYLMGFDIVTVQKNLNLIN